MPDQLTALRIVPWGPPDDEDWKDPRILDAYAKLVAEDPTFDDKSGTERLNAAYALAGLERKPNRLREWIAQRAPQPKP